MVDWVGVRDLSYFNEALLGEWRWKVPVMSSSFQDMGNICYPKVKLCMWRVLLDCIPSRANLVARGITLQLHLFPLCELQQESTEHILLHCPIAYSIWLQQVGVCSGKHACEIRLVLWGAIGWNLSRFWLKNLEPYDVPGFAQWQVNTTYCLHVRSGKGMIFVFCRELWSEVFDGFCTCRHARKTSHVLII